MQDLFWESIKENFDKYNKFKKVSPAIIEKNSWSPIFKYEVKAIANQTIYNEEEIRELQKSLRQ